MNAIARQGRRLPWLLCATVLALPATGRAGSGFAEFAQYATRVAHLVGWSKDSSSLVYTLRIEYAPGILELSDPMETVVVSARSGKETRSIDAVHHALDETQKNLILQGNRRYSGEAEARVALRVKGGDWRGYHHGDQAGWSIEGGAGMQIPCAIEKDETHQITPSHTFIAPKDATGLEVTFLWSPDGRRIAWLFQGQRKNGAKERAPNGDLLHPSFYEVVIDRTSGPRVQIIGNELLLDRIAEAIEKAGFAPTGHEAAKETPKQSMVYARKGQEANAKAIAAAIPGGAKVEPLKRKSQFDIVVALGRSVNAP